MTGEFHIFLHDFQGLAGSNANLGANKVNAGNGFCNAVLYLNTGVDFHEVEFVVGKVEQEFHCTDVGVVDALGGFDCQPADTVAHVLGKGNGRGFFQQFLIAALEGTFTLAQMQDFTVVVGDNLHFDVTGALDVMLEVVFGLGDVHQQI